MEEDFALPVLDFDMRHEGIDAAMELTELLPEDRVIQIVGNADSYIEMMHKIEKATNRAEFGRFRDKLEGIGNVAKIVAGDTATLYEELVRGERKTERADFRAFKQQLRAIGDVAVLMAEDMARAWRSANRDERRARREAHATSRSFEDAFGTAANVVGRAAQSIGGDVARGTGQAEREGTRNLQGFNREGSRDVQQLAGVVGRAIGRSVPTDVGRGTRTASKEGQRSFQNLAKGGGRSVEALDRGVEKGIRYVGQAVNQGLKALNVKAVQFSVKKAGKLLTGVGATIGLAKGGRLPGVGHRDTVPLGGGAVGAPGELAWVANRHTEARVNGMIQSPAAYNTTLSNEILGESKRHSQPLTRGGYVDLWGKGMAHFAKGGQFQKGGGLDFALGPETIPPIKYDPDHAGGNSHLHVTGTTTDWVVAIGKELQKMGWQVSEHPAFGGVNFEHSATGGHYDALAIDANTAADETHAELAKAAAILGGKGIGVGAAPKIGKIEFHGPAGPLKDMGQKAIDDVRKAGQKYLDSKAQTSLSGASEFGPGALSAAEFIKIALQALKITGKFPATTANANKLLTLAQQESGLDPGAENRTSAGMAAGLPQGIMQVVIDTFKAYAEPGMGDPFNPLHNIAASINYQAARYGQLVTHSPYAKGGLLEFLGQYRNGGVLPRDGFYYGHAGERVSRDRGGGATIVRVHLHGPGMDELIDEIDATVEDHYGDIAVHTMREGGANRGRARQIPGSVGRG
jgi:hypothetical protein